MDLRLQFALACRPACQLFAVDLAYAGTSGGELVTDSSRALMHLLCSHNVAICEQCVVVSGPQGASAQLAALPSGAKGHSLDVQWPVDYRGRVRVDLESARCAACWLCLQSGWHAQRASHRCVTAVFTRESTVRAPAQCALQVTDFCVLTYAGGLELVSTPLLRSVKARLVACTSAA